MRQLMSKESAPLSAGCVKLTGAEHNVPPDGQRMSAQLPCELTGAMVGVNPYAAEIATEPRLEEPASLGRKRLTGARRRQCRPRCQGLQTPGCGGIGLPLRATASLLSPRRACRTLPAADDMRREPGAELIRGGHSRDEFRDPISLTLVIFGGPGGGWSSAPR
jgi:hypothetical protein